MIQLKLPVAQREEIGKGPNRRLRMQGRIPAVVYGAGSEMAKVSVDARTFEKMIAGAEAQNSIFNLFYEGKPGESDSAVLREIQRDPLTRRVLHVDLFRIKMDVENDFEVAIHGSGTPVGVREGGVLETHLRSIEVRCLPTNLPSSITVNLIDLKINQSLHVSDLQIPEGVTVLTDAAQVVFTIVPPKTEAVAAPVEGEEVAQPEVIGKKKPEEGEEKEKK